MCMLPEDIRNKIMLFNSHPVADILKESSIFKYLQLREISIEDNRRDLIDNKIRAFTLGCDDGFDNDYHSSDMINLAQSGVIEYDEIEVCAAHYDIGFMHTLNKLNDDDEFEFDFKYSIIPINPIGTWYARGDFVSPLANPL